MVDPYTLVGVTSVAYCNNVGRENLTFCQVKSDLMSNNMKMSDDMRNEKFDFGLHRHNVFHHFSIIQ